MPRDFDFEVTARCEVCGTLSKVSYNMLEAGLETCKGCEAPLAPNATLVLPPESGARSPS